MFDFEIRKVKPEAPKPVHPEEQIKDERYKDIKSKLGKTAFVKTFGDKRPVLRVTSGIQRSEEALKWIADAFEENK
ncbi:hypothetical protein ACFLZ2_00485 [Candidatus Margulisiibacteriota bacterium]